MQTIRPLSSMEEVVPKASQLQRHQKALSASSQIVHRGVTGGFRYIGNVRINTWIMCLYTLLLMGTQLTLIWHPLIGLVMLIVCLFTFSIGALLRESIRKVSISLAIVPVVELVHSVVITHSAFESAALFYSLLILLTLVYRYMFTLDEPVERSRLHIKGHLFGLPLMIIIGEGLGLLGYAFLRNHYTYAHVSLPLVCTASIVFAFAEEMFLRGLIQQQAAKLVHPIVALLIAVVIYIPLAISHSTLLTIGPAVGMGVMLAVVYHMKHNLLLSVAINAAAKLTYVGLVATFILR